MAALLFVAGIAAGQLLKPAASIERTDLRPLPAPAASTAAAGAVYPADVVRINDGDTFEARVRIWPGLEVTTKVRLRSIDTPEFNARCADEFRKADAARDALLRILAEGDVRIAQVGLDKYGGRVLADVSTRTTPDVSAALLQAGHARRYFGGRRESWCG
jgi:endonuclease YncB( thermonuclease family)